MVLTLLNATSTEGCGETLVLEGEAWLVVLCITAGGGTGYIMPTHFSPILFVLPSYLTTTTMWTTLLGIVTYLNCAVPPYLQKIMHLETLTLWVAWQSQLE